MAEVFRTAACLAVGSELLGDRRLDSNSLTITRALARYGVEMREKRVVGDSVEQVASAIIELLAGHDVVILTGGLGPTADDVTREAVSMALARPLEHVDEVEGWIRTRYREFKRAMPEACLQMAKVVDGSNPLRNFRGTAPGLLCQNEGRVLAAFPGVPWEMEEMLERDLLPLVAAANADRIRLQRTLLLGGVVESEIEDRIRHLYDRFGRHNVSILASYGLLRLVFTAAGTEAEARLRLDEMEWAFREILGGDVAGVDVHGLAEIALNQLREGGQTLATAESCTGGLLSAEITDVGGASAVFLGGVISYSNDVKQGQLGVDEALLIEHGAVSEPVALAMARGVRGLLGTDWGVGITGIAGPTGGTEEKPIGLVHWAVTGPGGAWARHSIFPGDRSVVRRWSVNAALDLLRRRISG
ncbi:MAG: CinA family nicotinamide mononucleotide deamidase-related protein [Holophagae bacterium]